MRMCFLIYILAIIVQSAAQDFALSSQPMQMQFEYLTYKEVYNLTSTDSSLWLEPVDFEDCEPFMTHYREAQLFNRGPEAVHITSYVSLNKAAFKLFKMSSFTVPPEGEVTFLIAFVPNRPGSHASVLVFSTPTEQIYFRIRGFARSSQYKLAPLSFKSEALTLRVFNPSEETLEVRNVSSPEGLINVQPLARSLNPRQTTAVAQLAPAPSEDFTTTVNVHLNYDTLVVPAHVFYLRRGLNGSRNTVLLTCRDTTYFLPLIVDNSGTAVVKLFEFRVLDERFDAKISSLYVNPQTYDFVVGFASYRTKEETHFTQTFKLMSNDTTVGIEYTGFVLYDYIFYRDAPAQFQVGRDTRRELVIVNNSSFALWVEAASSSHPSIHVTDFQPLIVPAGAEQRVGVVEVNCYKPFAAAVMLHTSAGLLPYPVTVVQNKLEIFVIEGKEEVQLTGSLQYGNVPIGETKNRQIHLRNNGAAAITIEAIEHKGVASLHLVQHMDESGRVQIPNKIVDHRGSKQQPPLNMFPHCVATFEITIRGAENTNPYLSIITSVETRHLVLSYKAITGGAFLHPVDIRGAYPGLRVSKDLKVTNNFAYPLLLRGGNAQSEFIHLDFTTSIVEPGATAFVGSVTIALAGGPRADFAQPVTNAELKMWTERLKKLRTGEIYSEKLTLRTDLVAEVLSYINFTIAKPSIGSSATVNFQSVEVHTRHKAPIKILNPSNQPLLIQVLLAESHTLQEIKDRQHTATNQYVDPADLDEFENITPVHSGEECASGNYDEVPSVKELSQAPLPPLRRRLPSTDFIGKVQTLLFSGADADYRFGPRDGSCCERSFGFYLRQSPPQLIPPMSSMVIGPVFFQPCLEGEYNGKLLLRNNLTLFEEMPLVGRAQTPKLEFTQIAALRKLSALNVAVSIDELMAFHIDSERRVFRQPVFSRRFMLRNSGSIGVKIDALLFEGQYCNFKGFAVEPCEKGFFLDPGDSTEVSLTFTPDLRELQSAADLWLIMPNDFSSVPVRGKLPNINYELYTIAGTGNSHFVYFALIALTTCALLAVILQIRKYKRFLRAASEHELRSSKETNEPAVRIGVVCKYSPPVFIAKPKEMPVEIVEEVVPPVRKNSEITRPKKKNKIRKHTDVVANLTQSKPKPQQLPEVIATNALLQKKSKKRQSLQEIPPKNQEPDDDDDWNDFFIDDYKRNNALFYWNISDEWRSALDELKKDSDPVVNTINSKRA